MPGVDFYNFLLEQYGYDEPIFSKDLINEEHFKLNNISSSAIRQRLKRLTDNKKIQRYPFKDGIYFIPDPDSVLKRSALSINKILKEQYLVKKNKRIGYVTGLDFSNSLGLTTQVPGLIEIVTIVEKTNIRYVEYNQRRVALRKPKTPITEKNYKILQILELINNFQKVSDVSFDKAVPKIAEYIKDVKIEQKELDKYLEAFPKAIVKLWESGLLTPK